MRGLHGQGAEGSGVEMGEGNFRPGGVMGSGHRSDHFNPSRDNLQRDWSDDAANAQHQASQGGGDRGVSPYDAGSPQHSGPETPEDRDTRISNAREKLGPFLTEQTNLNVVKEQLQAAFEAEVTWFMMDNKVYEVLELQKQITQVESFQIAAKNVSRPIRRAVENFLKDHQLG